MLSAFSAWLNICRIPDEYFEEFMKKIDVYTSQSSDLAVSFLAQRSIYLIKFCMDAAVNKYGMFTALAKQIRKLNENE